MSSETALAPEAKPKMDGKAAVKDALDSLKTDAPKKPNGKKAAAKKPAAKPAKEPKSGKAEAKPAAGKEAAAPPAPAAPQTEAEAIKLNAEYAERWLDVPKIKVKVADIKIGDRYRTGPDPELPALAESINKFGLMQPLVLTYEAGVPTLLAGGRRLAACKLLGLEEVPCVALDPDAVDGTDRATTLLLMEMEENDSRVQPRPSDRVKRADLIAQMMNKSRKAAGGKNTSGKSQREAVARAAGVSHETLRLARVVLDAAHKAPEDSPVAAIAKKMENQEISIAAAHTQLVKVAAGTLDDAGAPVAKSQAAAFVERPGFAASIKELRSVMKTLTELAKGAAGERLKATAGQPNAHIKVNVNADGAESVSWPGLADLIRTLEEAAPAVQCPPCAVKAGELGKGYKACSCCGGAGHVGKHLYDRLVSAGDPSIAPFRKLVEAAAKG